MAWTLFPRKRPTISKTTLDLLLIFGFMAIFYGQPLLNPMKMSYGGDGMSLFLPSLEHYRQAMYHGIIPLWNSGTWLGAPFLAAFQGAVLYPPQFLTLFFDDAINGAVAAQNLLDTTEAIGRMRGQILDYQGIKVICTYHPAYLLRNPSAKGATWEDLKLVMAELGMKVPKK